MSIASDSADLKQTARIDDNLLDWIGPKPAPARSAAVFARYRAPGDKDETQQILHISIRIRLGIGLRLFDFVR